MGTSASSNGPGSGVSLDPAWLDDIDIPSAGTESNDNVAEQETPVPIVLAPKSRFSSARRNLSDYVRSGSTESLRRSLGHYSKTGMGGSKNVASRMRVSSKIASGFVNTFRSLRDNPEFELGKIISDLKEQGANASEIVKTIIDAVCPNGGSLDEELSRRSGTTALSDFMNNNPDADINNLSDDQIWILTGEYLGNEAFGRIQLDIGQCFERTDISLAQRVQRMSEMRDYIKAEIYMQLNAVRQSSNQLTNIDTMIRHAIENTFSVFEMEVDA